VSRECYDPFRSAGWNGIVRTVLGTTARREIGGGRRKQALFTFIAMSFRCPHNEWKEVAQEGTTTSSRSTRVGTYLMDSARTEAEIVKQA